MSHRIEMNSLSLQKNFPEVYKEFFSQNDLVMSGCYTFPWWPVWGKYTSHSIRVKSKLPLKCFVGIKKRTDNKIIFVGVNSYDIIAQKFEYVTFSQINKEESVTGKAIREYLDSLWYSGGLEINMLSETTRGHGFGFSGTSFAILSSIIHMLLDLIPESCVKNRELFLDESTRNKIFYFSWKLEMLGRYGNTTGQNDLNTLSNTKLPSILRIEDMSPEKWQKKLEDICFEHVDLHEKFPSTKCNDDILLDYTIVYSWFSTNTHQVEQGRKISEKMFDEYRDFLEKDIFNGDTDAKKYYAHKFLSEESLFTTFSDTISILNIKTILLFKELYETGFDSKLVEIFIEHINEYRYIWNSIWEKSHFADDFVHYFKNNQKWWEEQVGAFPIYSWKLWGGCVVVTKLGKSRNTIARTMEDLKKLYTDVELEYASYSDGECSDGIIIEQHLTGWLFSKYVNKDEYLFIDSTGKTYVDTYSEILRKESKGILLDMIDRKIYYDGVKLTSKDIPSQSAVIDVLSCLFYSNWNEISNSQLPISGYSRSKNEMLSKVILPFIHFIEEKIQAPFQLICRWNLSEFSLKLENSFVKIWIIRQM